MQMADGPHAGSQELVVEVGEIRDLFVAPDTDPLAQHEGEVMGEPALLRVVRKLMAARKMSGVHKLVVLLPEDKIEPGLAERASWRSCAIAPSSSRTTKRNCSIMRREAGRLLLRGMLILLVCVGISSVFRSETITFLPPLINDALGEGFNVIGWVMLLAAGGDLLLQPDPDPHVERGASVSAVAADRDSSSRCRARLRSAR